jgi:hypothetical protein
MLANPIYVGEIRHKKISYPGQHEPIVERAQWQRVQEMLKKRAAHKGGGASESAHGLLTGKLFDENGEPLYACWAKKSARRYRYFVSRKLIRGAHKTEDNGWRLPAEEIEQAVIAATRQMLSDRVPLASVLKSAGLAAPTMKQALAIIERKLKSDDGLGSLEVARSIIERLELRCEDIQITVNLGALLAPELSSCEINLRMTRLVPMQMKRRGVETRLVIPGEKVAVSRSDPALLRTVSRSYQWFGELASGSVTSTKQIAAREGLSHSYVRHVVALGLLAPRIIEAICAGQQSVTISAERLKDRWRLPIEWDVQQRLLAD